MHACLIKFVPRNVYQQLSNKIWSTLIPLSVALSQMWSTKAVITWHSNQGAGGIDPLTQNHPTLHSQNKNVASSLVTNVLVMSRQKASIYQITSETKNLLSWLGHIREQWLIPVNKCFFFYECNSLGKWSHCSLLTPHLLTSPPCPDRWRGGASFLSVRASTDSCCF